MAEGTDTPVVENTPLETEAVAPQAVSPAPSQRSVGPADDLREIQMLLAKGMFPGEVSPMVVKGFQFLGKLADTIEASAKNNVPQK